MLPAPWSSSRRISAVYSAAAVATFALACRFPKIASPLLYALTWYHFGEGDVAFATACDGVPRPRHAFLVPGAVTIAPVASAFRRVASVLACQRAGSAALHGRLAEATDLAIPATIFGRTPDADTFLAYFALWHSPRHVAMIAGRFTRGPSHRKNLLRFSKSAIPNTLLAIAIGAPAALWKPKDRKARIDAAILAITVPHLVAVALLQAATNGPGTLGGRPLPAS